MIGFMGRENLEDYNADFLVMLETWESARAYLSAFARKTPQSVEVAHLLGWTRGLAWQEFHPAAASY
jgi:hypothetical protein